MSDAPRYELNSLYSSIKDPAIEKDLNIALMQAKRLENRGKGKVADMSGADFAKILIDYEKNLTKYEKVQAYSDLAYQVDMNNSDIEAFYDTTTKKIDNIYSKTTFFTKEIRALPDEKIAELMQNQTVQHYGNWINGVRLSDGKLLDEETENKSKQIYSKITAPAVKRYNQAENNLSFELDGKPVLFSDLYSMGFSNNPENRLKAGIATNNGYGKNAVEYTSALVDIAKAQQQEDTLRGFQTPVEFRNRSNLIEDNVVDALVHSVSESNKEVAHRFYDLKAKWLGKDKISYWERNAPVESIKPREYTFKEAQDIVISAYRAFDPEMGDIAQSFFDEKKIDAEPRAGKQSGELAQMISGEKPFMQVNFKGSTNDILCLAHEVGHGIHYMLADKQGRLGTLAPITVNETASIFGEMLAFDYMMNNEKDPMQRVALTADKMNRTILTTFRQVAIHNFEDGVHKAVRAKGDLTPDEVGAIWNKEQKAMMGDSVTNDENSKNAWMPVSQSFRTPFYVYGYAFGECLTSSLYQVYESGQVKDFAKSYKEMLSKGATENYSELLKPFGLDASKPDFWKQGLTKMKNVVDNLEKLTDTLGLDKTKKQQPKPLTVATLKQARKSR